MKQDFSLWTRNVVDKYKNLSNEEIKNDLKSNSFPNAVLMSQIEGDFNFGNIIRTANNFRCFNIFYYGKKRWDRRSSVGCHNYMNVVFLENIDDIIELKNQYVFIGFENNVNNSFALKDFNWPDNSLIVFGEEGNGIQKEIIDLLDYTIEIPTKGSVRSLNVGSAASIALYDYYVKKC